MIKIIEKNVPLLLKRKKLEWDTEIKDKETIKQHQNTEEMKFQQIVKEEKQKIFKENRKERTKQVYQDNIRKGVEYEVFVSECFEKWGYKVKNHGIIHGKNDKGIDLIVMKEKVITLIQCKNWKADGKHKIDHVEIKKFIGETTAFLDNNQDKAEGYIVKRVYVTSSDILDSSAKNFLKQNNIVEHVIIPMI
jgi:hypothetical protein